MQLDPIELKQISTLVMFTEVCYDRYETKVKTVENNLGNSG